jgi:hypothetical protein
MSNKLLDKNWTFRSKVGPSGRINFCTKVRPSDQKLVLKVKSISGLKLDLHLYVKHKFVKNTNMSIQHMYIKTYGPAVSGRDRGIPELRSGADTLIRPVH